MINSEAWQIYALVRIEIVSKDSCVKNFILNCYPAIWRTRSFKIPVFYYVYIEPKIKFSTFIKSCLPYLLTDTEIVGQYSLYSIHPYK